MVDLLIQDVPENVVTAIDAQARRLGLSRSEYLRRQMVTIAGSAEEPVTVESLRSFGERFVDLDNAEVMRGAWE